MVAMLVLVSLLILMMATMMKSDAPSAEIITAYSGEAVLLPSGLQVAENMHVRWTHTKLVISLTNETNKMCHHRRCELMRNGSLRFSRVQPEDSGNYTLQLFDKQGNRVSSESLVLRVEEAVDVSSSRSHRIGGVMVSVLTCCFLLLLLLLIIILFILVRRRRQRLTKDPLQDVYMAMHSNHGNKGKEKQNTEEESHYVAFHASVSMETPITRQKPEDVEDIYV